MTRLTLNDLIYRLRASHPELDAERVADVLFASIAEGLTTEQEVRINALGTFRRSETRVDGRDEADIIFVPAEGFASQVNAPFECFAPVELFVEADEVVIEPSELETEMMTSPEPEPEPEPESEPVSEPVSKPLSEMPKPRHEAETSAPEHVVTPPPYRAPISLPPTPRNVTPTPELVDPNLESPATKLMQTRFLVLLAITCFLIGMFIGVLIAKFI